LTKGERGGFSGDVLTIVGWLWQSEQYHSRYTPENANIWARMIHRNLTLPHRFVLFTDYFDRAAIQNPKSEIENPFDPLIDALPLWDDYHLLGNPVWRPEFPQCYVRLKAFSKEMVAVLGPRFASIDLDCIVVGNLDEILGRTEDFVIYRQPARQSFDKAQPYNGSMWLMNTGCRPRVWEDFHGAESLAPFVGDPKREHFLQTDQGWMAFTLGLQEQGWSDRDGVVMWSWLQHKGWKLPDNARIVFFNGKTKPWDYLWIGENYG